MALTTTRIGTPRPCRRRLEWADGGERISVVIQLGSDAVLKTPTYDESISRFIDSLASVGPAAATLPSERHGHHGGDEVTR
jgi:hypothetical protein